MSSRLILDANYLRTYDVPTRYAIVKQGRTGRLAQGQVGDRPLPPGLLRLRAHTGLLGQWTVIFLSVGAYFMQSIKL